jgi:hypothetical protein
VSPPTRCPSVAFPGETAGPHSRAVAHIIVDTEIAHGAKLVAGYGLR